MTQVTLWNTPVGADWDRRQLRARMLERLAGLFWGGAWDVDATCPECCQGLAATLTPDLRAVCVWCPACGWYWDVTVRELGDAA